MCTLPIDGFLDLSSDGETEELTRESELFNQIDMRDDEDDDEEVKEERKLSKIYEDENENILDDSNIRDS